MTINAKEVNSMPQDPDALGPCGCIDYHMADCDLMVPARLFDEIDRYDPYYDDRP